MTSDPPITRAAVRAQAAGMLSALDAALPGRREELTRDPVAVLQAWPDVVYRTVPTAETGSRCSVAGAYYGAETPPVVAVADATSAGRRAFTALHELGHHLQQSDFDLAVAVDGFGAGGAGFEDMACDAFAADVLLPESLVGRHLPETSPTADHIVVLGRNSSASRAAVCVRAAQRLRSPGHVVLLDWAGVVQFAAAHGTPPVARDSDQSHADVVQRALTGPGGRARGRARFRYRDGIEGDELYAQAAEMDGYLIVVAVTDRPPWETEFTLPIAQTGPRLPWRICEHAECGHEFQTAERPCARCGVPTCPECGRCACAPVVREQLCPSCFTVYPLSFFDGRRCRNCA